MKGHEGLIKTRIGGKKPSWVFINTDDEAITAVYSPNEPLPDVWVSPRDIIPQLDLRYLVSMNVSISGLDPTRVTAVTQAALKAKAARVISNYNKRRERSDLFDVERIEDTEGVLTWESNTW